MFAVLPVSVKPFASTISGKPVLEEFTKIAPPAAPDVLFASVTSFKVTQTVVELRATPPITSVVVPSPEYT